MKMSKIVYDTLYAGGHSCIEAATGIGKSFGYLIAALLWCLYHPREAIAISTATKGLQDQLFKKDFPKIQKYIEKLSGKTLKAAILKGKANYVSRNRYNDYIEYSLGPDLREGEDIETFEKWLASTETGDLAEIVLPDYIPSSAICVDENSQDDDCFYQRALEKCRGANVIITNHHSVLTRLRSHKSGDHSRILTFEDLQVRNIIFDEAHLIEGIALELFTRKVSLHEIRNNISALLRFAEKKEIGLQMKFGKKNAKKNAVDLLKSDKAVLSDLSDGLRKLQNGSPVYVVNDRGDPEFKTVSDVLKKAATCLNHAADYAGRLLSLAKRKRFRARAVKDIYEILTETTQEIKRIQSGGRELVVWYSDVRQYPSIIQPDKNTALILQDKWKLFDSLVFTSATLMLPAKLLEDGWGYFIFGIGLSKHVYFKPRKHTYVSLPMPFQYQRVTLYAPGKSAPPPSHAQKEHKKYLAYVASMVVDGCRRDTTGGVMVLFTSYRDMEGVQQIIDGMPNSLNGRELIVQKRGLAVNQISSAFVTDSSTKVLFAVGAFWTGVDYPREQLTTLIITRLPFEVKDDPISWVRSMNLREDKRHLEYIYIAEPPALMKFRQGLGRLIRTKDDYGNIYIADARIRTKWRFQAVVDKLIPAENRHEFGEPVGDLKRKEN